MLRLARNPIFRPAQLRNLSCYKSWISTFNRGRRVQYHHSTSLNRLFFERPFKMSALTAAHQNKSTPGPYTEAHLNQNGPGDARPTGIQIVDDNYLRGKLKDKVCLTLIYLFRHLLKVQGLLHYRMLWRNRGRHCACRSRNRRPLLPGNA